MKRDLFEIKIKGQELPVSFSIGMSQNEVTIGYLGFNDIGFESLDGIDFSRKHCKLIRSDEKIIANALKFDYQVPVIAQKKTIWNVYDLGSRNGTFLNGKRINPELLDYWTFIAGKSILQFFPDPEQKGEFLVTISIKSIETY